MRLPHAASVVLIAAVVGSASGQTYTISTIAGGPHLLNIPSASASLYAPNAVAVDAAGNVFFVDYTSVLRVDAKTGLLTLVAGGGGTGADSGDNGPAAAAQLSEPTGVAVDSAGNVYIADYNGSRIRKVSDGVITTVAGNGVFGSSGDNGLATSAELLEPAAVAVDSSGNIYIAQNFQIREVSKGTITTVAGTGGPGNTNVMLGDPSGLAVDPAGNLFIADTGNNVIRKVANGVMTTVAGNGTFGFSGDNGPATSAQLSSPWGIAVDSAGNLYIADAGNKRVRRIAGGVITTVAGGGASLGAAGDNGPATSAQLDTPFGIALDSSGNLYIADSNDRRVRKIANGVITTLSGGGNSLGDNGPASLAQLLAPVDVAVAAGSLYISDAAGQTVRKISNGVIATAAGNGTEGFSGDNGPAAGAQLSTPNGMAFDSAGNLFIADSGNQRVREVSNGSITTVAGSGIGGYSGDNGPATSAQLANPTRVAVDSAGNLYITDSGNQRIRKVSNGVITTVAGNGTFGSSGDNGPATAAELNIPEGVAVDSAGNLFFAELGGNRVRKVANGVITTIAGNGVLGFGGDNGPATSAQLASPYGIAVDSAGDLFIADVDNSRIRRVSNGVITTVAGNGSFGSLGDNTTAVNAQLGNPYGVTVDSAGNVYIADTGRVRLLTPGTAPAISHGGIVPVYSSVPVIQAGSWVSIYGSNLAPGPFVWNGEFPITLGATSVTIDNQAAYLWLVSPTQINLQVPDDATTGVVSVSVTTPTGTATSTVTLAPYAPSFSLLSDARHVIGEILTANGTGAYGSYDLVGPSNTFSYNTRPVKAGETLVLFGVGFGPTSPSVTAGKPFSGAAPVVKPVIVTIGGVPANVGFAGITEAGLYQFNLTVPANTGSGDQPLQATTFDGSQTPLGVVVTVQ